MIRFIDALEKALIQLKQPVITKFGVFTAAASISQHNEFEGIPLFKQKLEFSSQKLARLITALVEANILRQDSDFGTSVYRILENADGSAEEVCCLVDPFCYISHLSAMRKYGFTNRIPNDLLLTTPDRIRWNAKRDLFTQRIVEEKQVSFHPPMPLHSVPTTVRGMKVDVHRTKYPREVREIREAHARITTVGDTFADMLDKPARCGGMPHVIEVWAEHAKLYVDEIIDSITIQGSDIVKARAGYLFNEVLGVIDPRIEVWLSSAQRGGSRVLDPERSFKSKFSEKWMLSIND